MWNAMNVRYSSLIDARREYAPLPHKHTAAHGTESAQTACTYITSILTTLLFGDIICTTVYGSYVCTRQLTRNAARAHPSSIKSVVCKIFLFLLTDP